mgnify:CR=1 FL=1
MKLIKDSIIFNEFIQQPKTTLSIEKLKDQLVLSQEGFDDVSIVHALISYPKWQKDVNLFQFVKHRAQSQLRKDPKCFFFFDASTEGFSTIHDAPFFDVLYFKRLFSLVQTCTTTITSYVIIWNTRLNTQLKLLHLIILKV